MRTLVTSLALLGPSTLALAIACADTDSSCEDTLSCPTASAGGTGGSAGGLGSVGGTGGSSAGMGGSSGEAGAENSVGGAGGSSGAGVGGSAGEGAGGSGVSGAGGTSDGCDGELLPGDDACVVDDQYGVFVSPEGDDGEGEGTREAPFRTLQRAADAAWEADKRVYACATGGAYVERLELGADHDGLELYGSFDCEDWSYDSQLRASVAPESGMALTVSSIANSLRIMGFGFESADATEAGGSSIAVFIEGSEGVVLESTRLSAGAGAKGADGETQEVVFPLKSELDGVNGTALAGGTMEPVECPAGGTTRGGAGGGVQPTGGGAGVPDHEGPGGEAGASGESCGSGGTGQDGADAPPAADGPGASTAGTLSSSGWTPADGSPGNPGLPGQGGGGGAGAVTGGGGSGGAGGCGGAGGAQGRGGGASIALLLLDAQVSLVDSVLVSDEGGDGGAGDGGQQGQQESGSAGVQDPDGCSGGSGGLGGNGGHGGGGAGGISAAIAYQGTAPTLSNSDTTAGGAGAGGEGAGADNDGVEGAAEALLEIIPL